MTRMHGARYQYTSFRPEPEMLSLTKRVFVIISAAGLVAACSDPSAPTPSRIAQPTAPRFDVDPTTCKSGYNVGQGRCNDDG